MRRRWGGPEQLDDPDEGRVRLTIVEDGAVVGVIRYAEEDDPKCRDAGIDIFLDPRCTGAASARSPSARSSAS